MIPALPPTVALRPEVDADRAFTCALYASTREDELAPVPWPAEHKAAFLRSQFEAQHTHYRTHYHDAEFSIIERDGAPIGRLYVHRGDPADVRIMDIALVPAARGAGLGGLLLERELEAAHRAGKTVSVHVERSNPALRLYTRLGFAEVSDGGVYLLLRTSETARGGDAGGPPRALVHHA